MFLKIAGGIVLLGLSSTLFAPQAPAEMEKMGRYSVDPVHSSVVFCVKHLGTSNFYGRFNEVTGSLLVDEDPAECMISLKIPASSVDTGNKDRDEHLKGPDFFNAREFASITFESSSVEKVGDQWKVQGELTLHGTTKEVTADVSHIGHGDAGERFGYRTGYEARFSIQRTDFGMSYGVPDVLGDQVDVIVALEGIAK